MEDEEYALGISGILQSWAAMKKSAKYAAMEAKYLNKVLTFGQTYGAGDEAMYKVALHTSEYKPDYLALDAVAAAYAATPDMVVSVKPVEFTLEKDSDEYIAKDAGFPLKAYTSSEKMHVRMIGGPHDGKVVSVKAGSEWMQWAFPAMTKTYTGEMSSSYQVRSFQVHKHDIDDTWYVLWSEVW